MRVLEGIPSDRGSRYAVSGGPCPVGRQSARFRQDPEAEKEVRPCDAQFLGGVDRGRSAQERRRRGRRGHDHPADSGARGG